MRAYLSKTWFVAIVAAMISFGASADVVTNSEPFTISAPTTWAGVTNIYTYTNGYSLINDNLELKDRSYVRIVGTKKQPAEDFGVRIADQSANDLTITINGYSGFYGTYRPSGKPPEWVATGIDPVQSSYGAVSSYVKFFLGAATGERDSAGRATIVVNSCGKYFGEHIDDVGFWAEYLGIEKTVKAHASGYIDFLQLNTANVFADITCIENFNTYHPARIIFNGGILRENYANSNFGSAPFKPATNTVIVLEGFKGNPVHLLKQFNGKTLNGGSGTIRFQGNCEVRLEESGAILPGSSSSANRQAHYIDPAGSQIEWKQTGPLAIIGNGFVRVGRTEGLPFRANEPEVRLRGNAILDPDADVYGHRVKLRTLISESSSAMVTNVTATSSGRNSHTATLVFGDGDTDGIFSAKCCNNINVEKVGSGLLVVSNVTVVGTLTIKEGRVMFAGENSFANKVVIEDGVEVVAGLIPSTDAIKTVDFSLPKYTGEVTQTYIKEGEDDVYLYPGEYMDGKKLEVKGGAVRFTSTIEDKYWRFTIKSAMDDQTGALDAGYFEINEMFLWPTNYVKASLNNAKEATTWGITTNTPAQESSITKPSQLAAERCMAEPRDMTWKTVDQGRTYHGPNAIFNSAPADCWQPSTYNEGKTVVAKLAETSTWFSVAFRLKDTALPAAGFAVARTHWSRGVGAWILSSSTSGRDDTWTVRHEHTVQWADTKGMYSADADKISEYPHCDDNDPKGKTQKDSEKWYHNADIYRFNSGGTAGDRLSGIVASVANGATLDTDYIGDQYLSFASLDLDLTAGGGTITKFSPGESGALYLSNLPGGTPFKKLRELPITIDRFVNEGRLASWNVYLDGVLQKGVALFVKDGRLCLKHSYGIYINFR